MYGHVQHPCSLLTTTFAHVCSNDVGVFANLTNAYCIVALGASENFYRCADSKGMPQVGLLYWMQDVKSTVILTLHTLLSLVTAAACLSQSWQKICQ
jgi:hypothetical protein